MATAMRAQLRLAMAICFSCWLWLSTEITAQVGFGGTGYRAQGGGVGEGGTGGGGSRPFGGGVGTGGTGSFSARALPKPILVGPVAGGIKCTGGEPGVRCLIDPCQASNVTANSPCSGKISYTCYANYCSKPTTFKGTEIPRSPCGAVYVKTSTGKVDKSCSPSIWPPPCVCPKIKKPVCGRNGKTYGNACLAKCAGVAIKWYDACAVCKKCGKKGPKVCGKNGKTYLNKCWLKCAGVKLAYAGACKPCVKLGGTCDLQKPGGSKCCAGSVCWSDPIAIPDVTKGKCYLAKGPRPVG